MGDSPAVEILRWYEENRRDLPWRRTTDPYAIWVSEVMLQQTRVETVLSYYEEFLSRFPSLETLAAASSEEVLAAWSGLGYYRRARFLHRAAREIVAAGGGFPTTLAEIQALPGVGAYTAAAVGSIAFGLVEPVIDGNVERLIGRFLGITEDPKRSTGRRLVGEAARGLLSTQRPGDSNQALMELGATICRPKDPRCPACPLAPRCAGRQSGHPEAFPPTRARSAPTRVLRRLVVACRQREVLLFRRPGDASQLAGMWEFPWSDEDSVAAVSAELGRRYGGIWRLGRCYGHIRHSITDRLYEIEILAGELDPRADLAEGREAGWFDPARIESLPVSSLVKKVMAVVGGRDSAALARGQQVPPE